MPIEPSPHLTAGPLGVAPAASTNLRDAVRTLVRDGMPSANTTPYGLVRLEDLTDQIPPTGSSVIYYARFSTAPGGRAVTYFAVAATIAAYRDGATAPDTIANGKVVADIDANGNFTLQTAPASRLVVSYGYQLLQDTDVDQFLDTARSWLFAYTGLGDVPDGLAAALVLYASALGCQAIARQFSLPNIKAGESTEDLSQIAAAWEKHAAGLFTQAEQSRASFWTSGDQPKLPAAAAVGLTYPNYQPYR